MHLLQIMWYFQKNNAIFTIIPYNYSLTVGKSIKSNWSDSYEYFRIRLSYILAIGPRSFRTTLAAKLSYSVYEAEFRNLQTRRHLEIVICFCNGQRAIFFHYYLMWDLYEPYIPTDVPHIWSSQCSYRILHISHFQFSLAAQIAMRWCNEPLKDTQSRWSAKLYRRRDCSIAGITMVSQQRAIFFLSRNNSTNLIIFVRFIFALLPIRTWPFCIYTLKFHYIQINSILIV